MSDTNSRLKAGMIALRDALDVLSLEVAKNLHTVYANTGNEIGELKSIDEFVKSTRERCLRLLALQQPGAKDLRFAMSVLRIEHDLERVNELLEFLNNRIANLRSTSLRTSIKDFGSVLEHLLALYVIVCRTWASDPIEEVTMRSQMNGLSATITSEIENIRAATVEAMSLGIEGPEPLAELVLACRHMERILSLLKSIPDEIHAFEWHR